VADLAPSPTELLADTWKVYTVSGTSCAKSISSDSAVLYLPLRKVLSEELAAAAAPPPPRPHQQPQQPPAPPERRCPFSGAHSVAPVSVLFTNARKGVGVSE
jgi:hypothetical protein